MKSSTYQKNEEREDNSRFTLIASIRRGCFAEKALILWRCLVLFFLSLSFLSAEEPASGKAVIEVQTAVFLLDLREIEGARQTFSADVFVRLRWKDPKLISPEGTRTIPTSNAWHPAFQIVNRIAAQTTLPEVLEVHENGTVTYRQRYIGQFSCVFDLREFPFDRQKITIGLAAPGKSADEVRFVPDPEASGIGNRFSITDWEIGKWRTKSQPYQASPNTPRVAGFIFELDIVRRFQFFLVQIIIPMALILGMSWIVFWLDPTQTGPRVSISITSMLTLVAYRLLTGSFLPRLSFLTRMDYFVFGCTLLVFLSLLTVVWISRMLLVQQQDRAIRIDTRARWFFPSMFLLMAILTFTL